MGIYDAYYNCRCAPFSLSPDPRFLYLSPGHREALAQLLYMVEERKGFAVLTGGVGLGKTTLLRTFLERLGPQVRALYVPSSPRFASELYAALWLALNETGGVALQRSAALRNRPSVVSAAEPRGCGCPQDHGPHGPLGCPRCKCDARPEAAPLAPPQFEPQLDRGVNPVIEVNRLLLEIFHSGASVVLIFDEAQRLTGESLEEVRALSNLERPDTKFLQVILAGQPELETLLDSVELRALRQRIVMRHSLSPLGADDTIQYIANRVRVAGAQRSPFTLDACRAIYRLSKGVPRLINLICDNAMLSAYAGERPQVDRRCVEMAAQELRLQTGPVARAKARLENSERAPMTGLWRRLGRALSPAALGTLIVSLGTLIAVLTAVSLSVYRVHLLNNASSRPVQSPGVSAARSALGAGGHETAFPDPAPAAPRPGDE